MRTKPRKRSQNRITRYSQLTSQLHQEWRHLHSMADSVDEKSRRQPNCIGLAVYLDNETSDPDPVEDDATNTVLLPNNSLKVMVMREIPPSQFASKLDDFVLYTAVTRFCVNHGSAQLTLAEPELAWNHRRIPFNKLVRRKRPVLVANPSQNGILNHRENSEEFRIANRVFRSMLTHAFNYNPRWHSARRELQDPGDRQVYFGPEGFRVKPEESPFFEAAFFTPFVVLQPETTAADLLKHATGNGDSLDTLAPELMNAFVGDLKQGLPVTAPQPGVYLGEVSAPDTADEVERELCEFHAIQLESGEVRLLPVVKGVSSIHCQPGTTVRAGDELGFCGPRMPDIWHTLKTRSSQYNTLPWYNVPKAVRDLQVRLWLDRKMFVADGKKFLEYRLAQAAITHPDFHQQVVELWWNVNTPIDSWNDSIQGCIFPAIHQRRGKLRKNVNGVYFNFTTSQRQLL